MSVTTIEVTAEIRDRLAELADDRGVPIGELVGELASGRKKRTDRRLDHAAATAYIREHLCPDLSDEDLAAGERFWREAAAGRIPSRLG